MKNTENEEAAEEIKNESVVMNSEEVKTYTMLKSAVIHIGKISNICLALNMGLLLYVLLFWHVGDSFLPLFVMGTSVFAYTLTMGLKLRADNNLAAFLEELQNSISCCEEIEAGQNGMIAVPLLNLRSMNIADAINVVDQAAQKIIAESKTCIQHKTYTKTIATEKYKDYKNQLQTIADIWFDDHVIASCGNIEKEDNAEKAAVVLFLHSEYKMNSDRIMKIKLGIESQISTKVNKKEEN